MQMQGLDDLISDRVDRRERGHGFLEYDRNPPAANAAHFRAVRTQGGDIDGAACGGLAIGRPRFDRVGKQDTATLDARRLGQDAHDGLANDGLAGAGFADQRDGRAGADAEAHPAHGFEAALWQLEGDPEVFDFEQILHLRRHLRYSSRSCLSKAAVAALQRAAGRVSRGCLGASHEDYPSLVPDASGGGVSRSASTPRLKRFPAEAGSMDKPLSRIALAARQAR
jgi:hypothetical protein